MKAKMQEEQEVRNKIEILFEYRKIPWLLKTSNLQYQERFSSQLAQLQIAIYELDQRLETIWDLNITDLKVSWLEIYLQLEKLGLSSNQQRTWSGEIERYQSRELDLRVGKSPLKYSMEDLYSFKSCDVRLIRRLIYQADPSLNHCLKFSEWTEFDLITEVNDDVEDIFEDLSSINGNRFLFSIYELGREETRYRYEDFIEEKFKISLDRLNSSSSESSLLMKEWMETICQQTLDLLRERLQVIDEKSIAEAKVIKNYTQAKSISC